MGFTNIKARLVNMRLSSFNYNLPKNLIAQKPVKPRDHSRLFAIDSYKDKIFHRKFYNIVDFLKKGDVLIVNNSKVFPARLLGKKEGGGRTEIFLLRDKSNGVFEALLGNFKEKNKKYKKIITVGSSFYCEVLEFLGEGRWMIRFNKKGNILWKFIYKFGKAPTPPYIKRLSNLREYQTVYAKNKGSVAAPTAGFHFTKSLIGKLKKRGIEFEEVTLHVGRGTFEPIRTDKIERHKIRGEWAYISAKTAKAVNEAKKENRRVIAVGTTAARTLESFADKNGLLNSGAKEVDLYIYPPYNFKIIDGLITNFHLPESSLMILVSAFLRFKNKEWKISKIIDIYKKAVAKKYRFYSFGDAMLIV